MFWEVVQALLGILGGTGALVLIVKWLSERLVEHRLAKDLEEHKKRLEMENAQAAANLRHELEKLSIEHEVRFRRIDKEVADAMKQAYVLLLDFYEAADKYVKLKRDVVIATPEEFSEEQERQNHDACVEANHSFQTYLTRNRPVIPKRLFRQLREVATGLIEVVERFRSRREVEQRSMSGVGVEYFDGVLRKLDAEVSPAFTALVDAIQERLGIDEPEPSPAED